MMLSLLKYDLEITYKAGKDMIIADLLSRAVAKTEQEPEQTDEEIVTHSIETHYVPMSPEKLQQLKVETANDTTLQTVITFPNGLRYFHQELGE